MVFVLLSMLNGSEDRHLPHHIFFQALPWGKITTREHTCSFREARLQKHPIQKRPQLTFPQSHPLAITASPAGIPGQHHLITSPTRAHRAYFPTMESLGSLESEDRVILNLIRENDTLPVRVLVQSYCSLVKHLASDVDMVRKEMAHAVTRRIWNRKRQP